MPKIFISYRRDDSAAFAGRICDRLASQFGRDSVFMDIDSIPFGVDFRQYLNEAVSRCDVLLALIGESWLNARETGGNGGRRLDNPRDFVRIEIEAALQRGIPVVPVLLGTAGLPGEQELPSALGQLAYRNAAHIDAGRDFHSHIDRLIRSMEELARARHGIAAKADEYEDVKRDFEEYRTEFMKKCTSREYLLRVAPGRLDRWRSAAEVGLGEAQALLGECYEEGAAVAIDKEEALRWYRKAAEAGIGTAMANLGSFYLSGKELPPNAEEAVRWLTKAADAGSLPPGLLYALGSFYKNGNVVERNEVEALHWYRKAAKAGDVEAMEEVGECYKDGKGIERDDAEALRWFRKAADAGKTSAMAQLGTMYREGRGVSRNIGEALRWFRKAAGAGNASAMVAIGQLYLTGDGVARDPDEAQRWIRKAKEAATARGSNAMRRLLEIAENGNTEVMYQVGIYYRDGNIVEKDRNEAIRWLRRAAKAGHQKAEKELAKMQGFWSRLFGG